MIPLSPPQIMDCKAAYLDGMLYVEVPMSQERRVKDIANYLQGLGAFTPLRVYTLNSLPNEILATKRDIIFVRATSLEELTIATAPIIEIGEQARLSEEIARIDGRIPTRRHV